MIVILIDEKAMIVILKSATKSINMNYMHLFFSFLKAFKYKCNTGVCIAAMCSLFESHLFVVVKLCHEKRKHYFKKLILI